MPACETFFMISWKNIPAFRPELIQILRSKNKQISILDQEFKENREIFQKIKNSRKSPPKNRKLYNVKSMKIDFRNFWDFELILDWKRFEVLRKADSQS